jgi:hypothetical protein
MGMQWVITDEQDECHHNKRRQHGGGGKSNSFKDSSDGV